MFKIFIQLFSNFFNIIELIFDNFVPSENKKLMAARCFSKVQFSRELAIIKSLKDIGKGKQMFNNNNTVIQMFRKEYQPTLLLVIKLNSWLYYEASIVWLFTYLMFQ